MSEDTKNGSDSSSQDKENILKLTEQQQNFIDECEKLFANRYTDEDAEYKSISESSIGDPPILDPWYGKPKRNFNWSGRRDDRRRDDHFRNDRRDDRRGDRYRNFDDNRRRDGYRNDRRDGYHNRDDGRYRNRYQNNYRDHRQY
ncbi:uncharacterized protein ZC262.2-like [Planococcus citri]|uniref:uncharacterized protein ZC262.2-like n=1 Tax=Planococcus citri TaxID=170843 RepID=UPI0031F8EAB1